MRPASRCNDDTAGGTIRPRQTFVTIDGQPWAIIGSPVDPHPPCPEAPEHCAPIMATGSLLATIDGVPVCREGDLASCGHAATGRPWIECD